MYEKHVKQLVFYDTRGKILFMCAPWRSLKSKLSSDVLYCHSFRFLDNMDVYLLIYHALNNKLLIVIDNTVL